ncbi:homoserine o-acetyltransferase [Fusarium langsethiae]|uniref:Homoserine o-acetyltransferase n=1 Tax=Fusarium langsethiae TaxID=179993 RepID=A0A0M9ERJ9_FUSLA|nr:homoserine o-acetyltransferase [Fusarium langsethiae]GKU06185.1 unnamed protein product [Fusarium langsethiae]GKU09647.1 unnamed protein product [Fusarium langsethiae]
MKAPVITLLTLFLSTPVIDAAKEEKPWPEPEHGFFNIANFTFDTGEVLDNLEIHYQTLGKLKVNKDGSNNAVVLLHSTTLSGEQFLSEDFGAVLFNKGQLLDSNKYFIIIRDAIGHGNSSKPSNTGLRVSFPKYQHPDIIRADHLLLTDHFGLNRTRLTLGVSMGGMHIWMMGAEYPGFSDALMPISSSPVEVAGHNRLFRKFITELITLDPAWKGGDYEQQPVAGLGGSRMIQLTMLSSPAYWQRGFHTRKAMDDYVDQGIIPRLGEFAGLKKIKVPLTAVNTADDWMNPVKLGFLEDGIVNDMTPGYGRAIVLSASKETTGHDSYIKAELWKGELEKLLARSGSQGSRV